MIPTNTAVANKTKIAKTLYAMGAGAVIATLTLQATSCVTSASKIDTPIVCGAFEPITWDEEDTKDTRRQIVDHNAVWNFYCKDHDE